MLKQRIITGVILLAVVLGTILYADAFWVRLLFAAVLFAAARELLILTLKISNTLAILFFQKLGQVLLSRLSDCDHSDSLCCNPCVHHRRWHPERRNLYFVLSSRGTEE